MPYHLGKEGGMPMSAKDAKPVTRKSQIDAVLLKLPGVVSKKIGGLDGYFVNDRMFACILVIMVIAVVMTEGIRWAERAAFPWRAGQ